jgi:hypothetical protein
MTAPNSINIRPTVIYMTGDGSWGDTVMNRQPMAIKNTVQLFMELSPLLSLLNLRTAKSVLSGHPL